MVFSAALARNMAQERSKPLHNFVLPSLKWGNRRRLRCMKVDSNGNIVSSSRSDDGGGIDGGGLSGVKRKKHDKTPPPELKKKSLYSDDGIENLRARLLLDLQAMADNMKVSIGDEKDEKDDKDEDEGTTRPWNLRTRRAACKAPEIEIGIIMNKSEKSPPKSIQLNGLAEMAAGNQDRRRKFSVPLTRDEIKCDLLMMTGSKPSRRPKKRAKNIQKELDSLFPGSLLTEVTTDLYRIPDETVEAKKK